MELLYVLTEVIALFAIVLVFCGSVFVRLAFNGAVVRQDHAHTPSVTVLMACFNEGESVYQTIKHVVESNYPKGKLFVVVVDDCSKDDSWAWMQKIAALHPNVTVRRNEKNLGKSKSLLRGLSLANTELILNVDSDGALDPQAIAELAACFVDPRVGGAGGNVLLRNSTKNWLTQVQTIQYNSIFQTAKVGETFAGSVNCISGAIFMLRRSIFEDIREEIESRSWLGHEVREGEDRFMTNLIINSGYRTVVTNKAKVFTDAPDNFRTFFLQQLRWRRGFFRTLVWGISPSVVKKKVRHTSAVSIFRFYFLLMLAFMIPALFTWLLITGSIITLLMMKMQLFVLFTLIHAGNYIVARRSGEKLHLGVLPFIALPMWMMIDLTLLTALAAFTLTSVSWETRVLAPAK